MSLLQEILQQDCSELHAILVEDRDYIIDKWYERAVEEMPDYRRAHRDEVRDHLPDYFEALCESLQHPTLTSADPHRKIAHEHGRQRFQDGWDLLEVVQDYQILRLVVIEHLNRKLDAEKLIRAVEIFCVLFDDSIAVSLKSYASYRDLEQQKVEKYFRRLADSAPVGILHAADDGTINYSNEAWDELVGPELENRPRMWLDGVHPEDREEVRKLWERGVEAGESWSHEFRLKGVSGKVAWVAAMVRKVEEPDDGYIVVLRDISERKAGEEHQNVLMRELDHRVKNTIALISAIAVQAGRKQTDVQEFVRSFQGRLSALSKLHGLMTKRRWKRVDLKELVELAVQPFAMDNAEIGGDPVTLEAGPAQALYLSLFELGTNASKYGALSQSGGRIAVKWRVDGREGGSWAVIEWKERGGPPVAEPGPEGFGSKLIDTSIKGDLNGSVERNFGDEGLEVVMKFPVGEHEKPDPK